VAEKLRYQRERYHRLNLRAKLASQRELQNHLGFVEAEAELRRRRGESEETVAQWEAMWKT
jgi:hypothetical protein